MATETKTVVPENDLTFNVEALAAIKNDAGLLKFAADLGRNAMTEKAVLATLATAALRQGEIDRAAKLNDKRSTAAIVKAYSDAAGSQPGRKPYTDTSINTMVSVMDKFALCGFRGAQAVAKHAVEHFKGAFSQRAAELGRMLKAYPDTLPTEEQMAAWTAKEKANKASAATAASALYKSVAAFSVKHRDALQSNPRVRVAYIAALQQLAVVSGSLKVETNDVASKNIAELMAMDAPASNNGADPS
jgi:anti-sigma28 factor (negative regulator of flagellin synthesis)